MSPAPPASYPIFNTPPELARGIKATGWDACDTASNHSLDQAQTGIDETGKALDRAGVEHTGSFPSAAAQREPLIVDVHGVRVALLAYTTDTNGIPLPQPWSVNIASRERVLADARRARRMGAEAVIVNLHWGAEIVPEYQPEPSSGQLDLVKRLTASAPDHGDRRPGPARRAADRAGKRQVRRLQRGQPDLEPEPAGGAARVQPGRPDRAARLRRQERRGRGAPGPLRAGVRQPPRLPGAAGRRRAEGRRGRPDPVARLVRADRERGRPRQGDRAGAAAAADGASRPPPV